MTAAPNLLQKQGQQQAQTVTFTAQMREAIELLELSNLDLQAHVDQKIMDNPFLESEGDASTSEANPDESANDNHDTADPNLETQNSDASEHKEQSDASELYEEMGSDDYENVWTSDRRLTSNYDRSDMSMASRFDHIADQSLSLRDHVQSQINTDISDPNDRFLASILLDHLNETGYFTGNLDTLAESLGCQAEHLQNILDNLKQCDPAGVFSTSLRECMEIQLRDLGEWDEKTESVLAYIDLFAEARIEDLLKKTGCTPAELKSIIDRFKRLDPKPGLQFSGAPLHIVVPDVFIRRSQNQSHWIVQLNSETLPKVLVTQDYKIRANLDLKKDRDLKKYYQDRMAEANWLVRALDQRAQNILKIVEELVKQQEAFLTKGVSALKPLTLKQVADAVGVHESTVSRITQNKYLNCPRGTFELRYFFSSSITNAWTGEDQSARQIQDKIQAVVNDEKPDKPLSDDAIVLKLSEHNLDVARRTVAKYRELLKIPSSYERKRRYKQRL